MTLFKSTNLASIFVSEDGRILSLTFGTKKGANVEIEIPSVEIRPMLQRISGALSVADSRNNLASQGVISAMSPSQTKARRTEDGEAVLISFRLQSTLEYTFALVTTDALRFGQQIAEEAQKNIASRPPTAH